MMAANTQKVSCAAPTLMCWMRKLRKKIAPSGASMITQRSGDW